MKTRSVVPGDSATSVRTGDFKSFHFRVIYILYNKPCPLSRESVCSSSISNLQVLFYVIAKIIIYRIVIFTTNCDELTGLTFEDIGRNIENVRVFTTIKKQRDFISI